jgi:Fe-S cluster assembly iron-binding protein IscA
MFQITDRAAEQLKNALSNAETPESACFRIAVVDNRVQLALDQERPGDTTIEHEGDTLVVLDPTAEHSLGDRELDFDADLWELVLNEAG